MSNDIKPKLRGKVRKFCSDKDGQLVLAQKPNLPIVGWFVFKLVSMVVASQPFKTGLESVATGFLLAWAYLEITKGDSNFRKLLGLVVFVFIILSLLS